MNGKYDRIFKQPAGSLLRKVYRRLLYFVKKRIFSVFICVFAERDLSGEIKEIVPRIDVKIKNIGTGDIASEDSLLTANQIEKYKTRLEEGDVCFAAVNEKGNITGYVWFSGRENFDAETGITIKPGSGGLIVYDSYTVPLYRGNNIASFMLYEVIKYAAVKNLERAYILYLENNISSRKTVIKNDFTETYRIRTISVLGLKLKFFKELAPSICRGKILF